MNPMMGHMSTLTDMSRHVDLRDLINPMMGHMSALTDMSRHRRFNEPHDRSHVHSY